MWDRLECHPFKAANLKIWLRNEILKHPLLSALDNNRVVLALWAWLGDPFRRRKLWLRILKCIMWLGGLFRRKNEFKPV